MDSSSLTGKFQLIFYNHRSNILRIALLQKEEERARKKIVETTEKASDVLQMREKNVSRLKQWDSLTTEDLKKKREMQLKFKREEEDARIARYILLSLER